MHPDRPPPLYAFALVFDAPDGPQQRRQLRGQRAERAVQAQPHGRRLAQNADHAQAVVLLQLGERHADGAERSAERLCRCARGGGVLHDARGAIAPSSSAMASAAAQRYPAELPQRKAVPLSLAPPSSKPTQTDPKPAAPALPRGLPQSRRGAGPALAASPAAPGQWEVEHGALRVGRGAELVVAERDHGTDRLHPCRVCRSNSFKRS